MDNPDAHGPEVNILLLGDAEVGKSTFLSRLTLGVSTAVANGDDVPPPYSLPVLRDLDQPFQFNIRLYRQSLRLSFYDTASPQNYTLLRPDLLVLCFDISRRSTLESLFMHWRTVVEGHFNYDESLPVLVLGLKRDLRQEWTEQEKMNGGRGKSVMPQEALQIAQQMRCDRYAECSALTGELCKQVLEDLASMAAKTTTEGRGKTEAGCAVM